MNYLTELVYMNLSFNTVIYLAVSLYVSIEAGKTFGPKLESLVKRNF